MRSPIAIVDVDRLDTWTRYRAGLCDTCAANCCTMPLEVQLPDLVRLELVDPFEAEHEELRHIAKRLLKARLIDQRIWGNSSLRHGPAGTAIFWTRRPGCARCMTSGPRRAGCTHKRRAPSLGTVLMGLGTCSARAERSPRPIRRLVQQRGTRHSAS